MLEGRILVGGFSVPPKGPDAPERARAELLLTVFVQYDAARVALPALETAIVYGDLNPSASLERLAQRP